VIYDVTWFVQMFSDMPADDILEMHRKEPSLPRQPETGAIAAATHFSSGVSIVRMSCIVSLMRYLP